MFYVPSKLELVTENDATPLMTSFQLKDWGEKKHDKMACMPWTFSEVRLIAVSSTKTSLSHKKVVYR